MLEAREAKTREVSFVGLFYDEVGLKNRGNFSELSRRAFEKGDHQLAHRCLLRALRQDGNNITYLLLLAWTASNRSAQLHFFEQVLERQPGNPLAIDGISLLTEKAAQARTDFPLDERPQSGPKATALPAILITDHIAEGSINPISQSIEWAKRMFNNISYCSIIYLLLIAIGESLFILDKPQIGLSVHGILFSVIILHAAFASNTLEGKFLLSLSFAPLIRLLSLSMPLEYFPVTLWYVVVGIPLLVAAIYAGYLIKINPNMLGLNLKQPFLQGFVALSGIGFGYIEFLLLRPDPFVPRLELSLIWGPALILLIFTGALEEFIFRGLLQTSAIPVLGRTAVLYVAVLFAVLHFGTLSVMNVLFVFGVGLFFGLITLRTQSIIGVALSHSMINIMLYLVCPFVSLVL